jgi:hypothetical protein
MSERAASGARAGARKEGSVYGLKMIFRCPLCCTTQQLLGEYTIRAEIGEGVKCVAPLGEGFVHYRADAKQLCIECATEYATEHLMDAMYVAEVHGELPPGMLEEWQASFDC